MRPVQASAVRVLHPLLVRSATPVFSWMERHVFRLVPTPLIASPIPLRGTVSTATTVSLVLMHRPALLV